MNNKQALKLIETAVTFYIRQNYEVGANLYQLGYDSEGYARVCYDNRERFRQALELARQGLLVRAEVEG